MKKIVFLLITGLFLTIPLKGFALDAQPQGQLEVIVVACSSPNFINEWVGASYAHAPTIETIKEVKRGQTMYVAVIVSGFGIDNKGGTDLVGDFMLLEPDAKVATEQKNVFHYKANRGGLTGGFVMMDPTLDLVLEEGDAEGAYTIRAVVRDNVLNKTATGEYKVVLKEAAKESSSQTDFTSDKDFSKWMTYYYLEPQPEKIPAAIKFYADSPLFGKVSSRMPMIAFFAATLKDNSELMKKVYTNIFNSDSLNSKVLLLRALWLVNNSESKEFINKAKTEWKSDEISKQIEDILAMPAPNIFNDQIKDPALLDMLWANFLATGDSAAVKRIISVLHFKKDGHGMDILIAGAAEWSLSSNAIQHRKVYEICKEELKNSDGETKKILEEIIKKVDNK